MLEALQQECSLGDFVGGHGSLGPVKDLKSELLNVGARRHIVGDCLVLGVLTLELFFSIVMVSGCLRPRKKRVGFATHLLQLIHEVCCIDLDLVIRGVNSSLDNLVHNMKIACRRGELVRSSPIAGKPHAHQ